MFGLEKEDYEKLLKLILHEQSILDTPFKIWVIGSRSRGNYRPSSDIDLVFEGEKEDYLNMKMRLIDLKLQVDHELIFHKDIKPETKEQVEKEKQIFFTIKD